jgi:hypothetical protein
VKRAKLAAENGSELQFCEGKRGPETVQDVEGLAKKINKISL